MLEWSSEVKLKQLCITRLKYQLTPPQKHVNYLLTLLETTTESIISTLKKTFFYQNDMQDWPPVVKHLCPCTNEKKMSDNTYFNSDLFFISRVMTMNKE